MFGFVKPYTPELLVRENELYRAIYCGLCSCMGRTTLLRSRVTLSYDIVFLALMRIALTGERVTVSQRRCPVHPFRKRPVADPSPQLEYCSKISAYLSYYNIKDKIKDGRGIKKVLYRVALLAMSPAKKRASLSEAEEIIVQSLARLDLIEAEGTPSVDAAAEVFGDMLAQLCALGLTDKRDIAAEAGRHTGRFIYIADAIKDYEDDVKTGSYNPFICMHTDPREPEQAERLFDALSLEASRVYGAAVLAEPLQSGVGGLCENIARLGLVAAADGVCHPQRQNKHKHKHKGSSYE